MIRLLLNKNQKVAYESQTKVSYMGQNSFLIRYFGEENGDRLLIVNFGPDHYFNPAPEPLLTWLKIYPHDLENAKKFLTGLEKYVDNNCGATIAEIFDSSDPYHARGCFAQAWSVAEFLRAYVKVKPELQKT